MKGVTCSGFNAAIALNANSALAFYNRGNVYYAKGDYTAAIADFSQALRLNPKLPYARMNRGNAYSNLGKFDEALADLDEAVRQQPEISDTWFNRAIVHARRRDLKAALADYEAAIARDANDGEAASARRRLQAFLDSDGNTAALDTTKILSEIAHARHVEGDDVAIVDPLRQRRHKLDVCADAVEEEDRALVFATRLRRPHRIADFAPADAFDFETGRARVGILHQAFFLVRFGLPSSNA